MPFANLRWPNLGISLLKGGERFAKTFPARLPTSTSILQNGSGWNGTNGLPIVMPSSSEGERLFAREFFGNALPGDEQYFAELRRRAGDEFGGEEIREWLAVSAGSSPVSRHLPVRRYDWSKIKIGGFSASFQQTLALPVPGTPDQGPMAPRNYGNGWGSLRREMGIAPCSNSPRSTTSFSVRLTLPSGIGPRSLIRQDSDLASRSCGPSDSKNRCKIAAALPCRLVKVGDVCRWEGSVKAW